MISSSATPTPAAAACESEKEAAGRTVGEPLELRADVRRRIRIQKTRIAELLDTGVHERRAEEQPQREESHHAHYGGERRTVPWG
jgi:hypothetical protein